MKTVKIPSFTNDKGQTLLLNRIAKKNKGEKSAIIITSVTIGYLSVPREIESSNNFWWRILDFFGVRKKVQYKKELVIADGYMRLVFIPGDKWVHIRFLSSKEYNKVMDNDTSTLKYEKLETGITPYQISFLCKNLKKVNWEWILEKTAC